LQGASLSASPVLTFGNPLAEREVSLAHNQDGRIRRAIRDVVERFRGSPITQELLDDVAQEVELLIIQHVPTRPEVQVTHSAKRGLIDVTVRLADQEPRR
jgi:hypothetical protein